MSSVPVINLDSDEDNGEGLGDTHQCNKPPVKNEILDSDTICVKKESERNVQRKGRKRTGTDELPNTPPKKVKCESSKTTRNKAVKGKKLAVKTEQKEIVDDPCCSKQDDLPSTKSGDTNSSNKTKMQITAEWKVEDVIAEKLHLNTHIVKNVIRLFEADNTIPFIARYRKEETGSMEPEMLRSVKNNHERLVAVKQKMESVVSSILNMNKMTPPIMDALRSSQTMNEIEHIYAQFKQSGARTLAERARNLGLEPAAMAVLHGTEYVTPEQLVNEKTESLSKVLQGLQHIIADVISKNKNVLDTLRNLCEKYKRLIHVETKRIIVKAEDPEKPPKKSVKTKKAVSTKGNEHTAEKFKIYFSFKTTVIGIKPHQVLAIYRGESLKILNVKIILPEWFYNNFSQLCHQEWLIKGLQYSTRESIMKNSLEDAYTRLLQRHMIKHIRSNLLEEAHLASIEVFARNLKQLLLTPPVRGEVVMGIDPGFRHGCKLAVVNTNGEVLATDVIYLHSGSTKEEDKKLIHSLLFDHQCNFIALGNGTACRETEKWISSLISSGYFKPLNVKYTIVDEQGASIYSCSTVAKQEFPNMDPNLISAVSLARRLQDPLSELVKVEPKHLGVGMYQHDIPEKKLLSTLNEVVVECVSFVGVDVNTASETLLCHIAGLNASRAANILDWRSKNGPFLNRDQLNLVKGIGPKSFEQCAGFLRIVSKTSSHLCFGDLKDPITSSKSKKKSNIVSEKTPNPLDQTWIHPESYSVVYWFLEYCGVSLAEFDNIEFFSKISSQVDKAGISKIALQADISEEKLKFIIEGLKQKPDDDIRSKFQKPLFRSSISSINDLKVGANVTGRVQNVTHFGAFVDIGVGQDGLLHISKMCNVKINVGDHIEVKIQNVDTSFKKPKISLGLVCVL